MGQVQRISLFVGLLGLALLLREAAPDEWQLSGLQRAILLGALLIALAAQLRPAQKQRTSKPGDPTPSRRRMLLVRGWSFMTLLALMAAFAVRAAAPDPPIDAWRVSEEARIEQRFQAVRDRLLSLEETARQLADASLELANDPAMLEKHPEGRVQLFDALEQLLARARAEQPLLTGHEVGIQVFHPHGELLAWAGSVHAEATGTRLSEFTRGSEETYFRRCGIYTLLTYDRQPGRTHPGSASGETPDLGYRIVVDLPVELAYRLRNRFLRSWSLDDELSGGGIEVDLLYEASTIPPYLTQVDLEIGGSQQSGMQAEFVVRADDGSLRALGRIASASYEDRMRLAAVQREKIQRWLAIAALILTLITISVLARDRWPMLTRLAWNPPLLPIVALWGMRGALAWLQLPTSGLRGSSLLDPVFFAISGFGGVLRTPLDLLLTSLTLLATAGLLFLHAVRRATRSSQASGTANWSLLRTLFSGLLAAGIVAGVMFVGLEFAGRVVANSSPRLIGTELDLVSPATSCLLLALLAAVASALVLGLLAVAALIPLRGSRLALSAAVLLLGGFVWWQSSLTLAVLGVTLIVAGAWLRALLIDERFTSFGLAAFALAAFTTTLCSEAIHREYFRVRQSLVQERADNVRQLVDELRPFVLQQVLEDLRSDIVLRRGLRAVRDLERGATAFKIWAGSILSDLGWSCQVRVYDGFGDLASEFSVDMPYGRDTPTRELQDRARAEGLRIEQTEVEAASVGRVRLYRGAVPAQIGRFQGTVVIDLPFAHESLAPAANPRARTPELLRTLQEEGAGPRVEESERYLLAWLEQGSVTESSTPYLEVGQKLDARASDFENWQRLELLNGAYLITRMGSGERVLVAGFRLSGPLDRLLEWAQIGSLYFGITLLLLLVFVALGRVKIVAGLLPTLLVPKRIGFQQKLMGAFLVVALLPSVVLSLATRDIMRDRSVSRNRDAALAKARSAEAALADLVRREIDTVRESEYLRGVMRQEEAPPVRDIGHLEFSQIMVFHGDGRLILDETLSDLSDDEARGFVSKAPGKVFASQDDSGHLNLGALVPVWFSPEEGLSESAQDARLYYLYYRRRLTDGLLRDLAPILNTDLSAFLGPQLVASSQKSLAIAGLLPSLVPPEAYKHVLLRRNRYTVIEERSGQQRYFAGYLPLEDRFGQRIAVLSVSQLLQPDEFAVEVERTRALVVGLSTLMFVLTLILGAVFAARIFDPVRNLIAGTRRLAKGEFGFRLQARAGDEIGELERSFNEMVSRLELARAALEERRHYLEAVLGNIASGVVTTDLQGRITSANAAALRILGLPPESLQGRAWGELARETQDAGARTFWSNIGDAPDGEVFELTMLRDRERLTLRLIVTDLRPSEEAAAESLGRVAIFEDVTQLIHSKKLAAWAEMARQVAHEIKNPLTPLKSEAQFMERAYQDKSERFPEIFSEGMRTIIRQVDALRRIASEFSNFGRVQKLHPRPVDLGALLREVARPYRNMEGLEVEIHDGGGGGFPGEGVQVLADEEGLRKVFSNIFENARESMRGHGRLSLRVQPPEMGRVEVIITDEGEGVADEVKERLFEPYFSTKSTGTGLGLAITRSILEELGGSISLGNLPGGGAEARVTLVVC